MADERKAVRLLISGRVQGVGYRDWLVMTAKASGLDGWVRNLSAGEVEAVLAGPPAAVDRVVSACYDGPPSARVLDVALSPAQWTEKGFRRLPTA